MSRIDADFSRVEGIFFVCAADEAEPMYLDMANAIKLRAASGRDFPYIVALAARFTDEVGFIPREALNTRLWRGEVTMAIENGDPAGYILAPQCLASARTITPIFQAAVQMDAQRRHIGLALVERVAKAATQRGSHFLQCFVRQELEANEFFAAAGFRPVAMRTAQTARGRSCVLWRRQLVRHASHSIFYLPPTARFQAPAGRFIARSDVHQQPILQALRRRVLTPADVAAL